uniref:RNase H type-1 domain-containing protein n=1 Tax=Cannabis sativa TaxID=3483 RepID=A0A803Q236_CANSA
MELPKTAEIICCFSASHLDQYHKATQPTIIRHNNVSQPSSTHTIMHTTSLPQSRWQPPDVEFYKMNLDTALDVVGAIIGIGAIIRNHDGEVVACYSKPIRGCYVS